MDNIRVVVVNPTPPENTNVLWLKPSMGRGELYHYGGGMWNIISGKESAVLELEYTEVILYPNIFNIWKEPVDSLKIKLSKTTSLNDEFMMEFKTGDKGMTLDITPKVLWLDDTPPDFNSPNTTFQVSIMNGLAVGGAFTSSMPLEKPEEIPQENE